MNGILLNQVVKTNLNMHKDENEIDTTNALNIAGNIKIGQQLENYIDSINKKSILLSPNSDIQQDNTVTNDIIIGGSDNLIRKNNKNVMILNSDNITITPNSSSKISIINSNNTIVDTVYDNLLFLNGTFGNITKVGRSEFPTTLMGNYPDFNNYYDTNKFISKEISPILIIGNGTSDNYRRNLFSVSSISSESSKDKTGLVDINAEVNIHPSAYSENRLINFDDLHASFIDCGINIKYYNSSQDESSTRIYLSPEHGIDIIDGSLHIYKDNIEVTAWIPPNKKLLELEGQDFNSNNISTNSSNTYNTRKIIATTKYVYDFYVKNLQQQIETLQAKIGVLETNVVNMQNSLDEILESIGDIASQDQGN